MVCEKIIALTKSLVKEALMGIQYKRLPMALRVLAIITLSPFFLAQILTVAFVHSLGFIYNLISAPVEYLEFWQRERKDEVKHATQCVIYLVSTPFIFFLRIMLAFFAPLCYMVWLFLMAVTYIITLGGVRWQPTLNKASYDETFTWSLKPSVGLAKAFVIVDFVCVALAIFFKLIYEVILALANNGTLEVTEGLVDFHNFINDGVTAMIAIYLVLSLVVNPILFRKKKVEPVEEETEEVAE
ncbi:MAG: hypothetical protein J6B29_05995 [Clostridia bacterium]|nr:hypothetical protein [Clostridia bacterium]